MTVLTPLRPDDVDTRIVVRSFTGYSATAPAEHGILVKSRLTPMNGTLPIVLVLHGATSVAILGGAPGIAQTLAEHGLPALAVDAGADASNAYSPMANDVALARIADAITYAQASLGAAAGKVMLFGVSMGSVQVLIYAAVHPDQVSCVACALPAVDLEDVRANDRGGFADEIEGAFGGNAGWQAARPTRNVTQLADNSWATVPVGLWISSGDTIALPGLANAWAARTGAETFASGTSGHNVIGLLTDDIAVWMLSHAP